MAGDYNNFYHLQQIRTKFFTKLNIFDFHITKAHYFEKNCILDVIRELRAHIFWHAHFFTLRGNPFWTPFLQEAKWLGLIKFFQRTTWFLIEYFKLKLHLKYWMAMKVTIRDSFLLRAERNKIWKKFTLLIRRLDSVSNNSEKQISIKFHNDFNFFILQRINHISGWYTFHELPWRFDWENQWDTVKLTPKHCLAWRQNFISFR